MKTKGMMNGEPRTVNRERRIQFSVLRSPFIIFLLPFLVSTHTDAQEPASPTFVLNTLSGPQAPAPLAKMQEDWSIELSGKTKQAFSSKQWLSLRQEGVSVPPFPVKNCLLLTSGDRILLDPGAPVRLDDEQLYFRSQYGTEVSVPLAYLSYFCAGVPENEGAPDIFLDRLAKTKRPRDVLYLKNGDRMQGKLTIPARGPTFTMYLGDRSTDIPQDQVAVWAMNSEYQAHLKTKKPFAHVVTTGGARLQFASVRYDPQRDMLAGKTLFGAKMDIQLRQVAALTMRQGQAVYLSDLVPKGYDFTPFLGIHWPLVPDANLAGRQLSLGRDFYDKGLAMHAKSQVTYDLDGPYKWFEALVGLEDTASSGQAQVSVTVDGKSVLPAKELNRLNPVLPVRIDIAKARSMTLSVDFSNFGDVQARVNWADARLIKEGQ
jgi:NPCBM/NEW2 domain